MLAEVDVIAGTVPAVAFPVMLFTEAEEVIPVATVPPKIVPLTVKDVPVNKTPWFDANLPQ
jgi:hypothetical protein